MIIWAKLEAGREQFIKHLFFKLCLTVQSFGGIGAAMRSSAQNYSTGSIRLMERRLTKRIQNAWQQQESGRLPSWREFQSKDFGDDWTRCFGVDLRLSDDKPYFVYLGDSLSKLANVYLLGERQLEQNVLDVVTAKMDEAALNRRPISFGDVLRLDGGRRIAFRSIILPLADNGVDVTHAFGAVNGRKI